jgi:predicted anti-sigma-YlaC factor YlaD
MTDFLEGEARESICEQITRHMVDCEKCRMYVDTHGRIIKIYRKWRDDKLTKSAVIKLRTRIAKAMAGGGHRKRRA